MTPSSMQQVALNLIGNTLDAVAGLKAGRIQIDVQTKNGNVEVIVADNGLGVAPEHHQSLYDPFRSNEIEMVVRSLLDGPQIY